MGKKRIIRIIGIILLILMINFVIAEKLEINIEEANPENINFKIILYDDNLNKIEGKISYALKDYFSDIIKEGIVNSGEEVNVNNEKIFEPGSWELSAGYKDKIAREIFNIGELKKIDVKLEGDNLIIKNIGNVIYDKEVLIHIGEYDETAWIYLGIGQEKRIRLTAPSGEYTIRVDDGSSKENLVFSGVSLTGNVIGLETENKNFWKQYPLTVLFLISLIMVVLVVFGLKFHRRISNKNLKRKKR